MFILRCIVKPVFFHDVCVAANALHATNNFQIIPDFSLKDSLDQTVLGLALWTGTQHRIRTKKLVTMLILNNTYYLLECKTAL